MQSLYIVLVIIATAFASCKPSGSVVGDGLLQKRKYTKGWHVNINGSTKKTDLTASSSNAINLLPAQALSPLAVPKVAECDIITLRNGDELEVQVIEIGATEIKYKKCSYLDGPIYAVPKSDVFMIKYPNGTKDVFKEKADSPPPVEESPYELVTEPHPSVAEAFPEVQKELTYSEKYAQGQADALSYHRSGDWYYAGVLLGLIGILIAALSNPQPKHHTPLAGDHAYRKGYTQAAKNMNTTAALYGWLVFLAVFFIILLVATA